MTKVTGGGHGESRREADAQEGTDAKSYRPQSLDLAGCQDTCGSMREGGMTDMTPLTRTSLQTFAATRGELASATRSGYLQFDRGNDFIEAGARRERGRNRLLHHCRGRCHNQRSGNADGILSRWPSTKSCRRSRDHVCKPCEAISRLSGCHRLFWMSFFRPAGSAPLQVRHGTYQLRKESFSDLIQMHSRT